MKGFYDCLWDFCVVCWVIPIKDGKKEWDLAWDFTPQSAPCPGADDTVLAPNRANGLYGIRNGAKEWLFETDAMIASPVMGSDGIIYAGSLGGSVFALQCTGKKGKKGIKKLWEFKAGQGINSPPCLGKDGTVYVSDYSGKLTAIRQGKKVWDVMIGGPLFSSPCVAPDGTVYVGSSDGHLHAVKDGRKIWTYKTGGEIKSSPCIGADGTVYVGSNDKKVYALKDGYKVWEFETGGEVESSPFIGPDGLIYIGSNDRKIYALKPLSLEEQMKKNGDTKKETKSSIEQHEGWVIIDNIKLPVNHHIARAQ